MPTRNPVNGRYNTRFPRYTATSPLKRLNVHNYTGHELLFPNEVIFWLGLGYAIDIHTWNGKCYVTTGHFSALNPANLKG